MSHMKYMIYMSYGYANMEYVQYWMTGRPLYFHFSFAYVHELMCRMHMLMKLHGGAAPSTQCTVPGTVQYK